MSKRIVSCIDGTWQKMSNDTNVCKLYRAVMAGPSQVKFYDDGVGADGIALWRLVGGALGTGLFAKIKQGYMQVAHAYDPGDEIFLFGFSRGAYTARSVAGMIAVCGLPTKPIDEAFLDAAFDAYRFRGDRTGLLKNLNARYGMFDAKIKMVGVWDTVGALGIPAAFGGVDELLYGFLDTSLHPDVLNGCHAMAIDERRCEFPATLWTSEPANGQTVEQVWFCGVHGDVGGGEQSDPANPSVLSDITLGWMINRACALGLDLDTAVTARYALPMDPKFALDLIHMSWNPLWGFPRNRQIAGNSTLANSVMVRCQHQDDWRPKNLQFANGLPAESYQYYEVVKKPADQPVATVAAQAAFAGSS